jgi:glycolate oxidase
MSVVNKIASRVGLAPMSALQAEHLPGRDGQDIFRPRSAGEVQEIIRYANRHRTPVFTRSSPAANGDGRAHAGGGILIDLSGMDSIINVDTRNRAVRFEPGVTWGRLVDELKRHQLKLSNPLLPRKDDSALAGFLDREPMLIPRFEYGEPLLTMELVLPTGTIFRTGSASGPPVFKKTRADMVGPYGPASMDMFRVLQGSRGTMGVVTWINVKAEYLPETQKVFFLRCKDIEEIAKPLYRIPRLMIGNEILALNGNDLAAILSGGKADLLPGLKQALPPWTIVISLAGSPRLAERKLKYEEEALRAAVKELGMELAEDPGVQSRDLIPLLQNPW